MVPSDALFEGKKGTFSNQLSASVVVEPDDGWLHFLTCQKFIWWPVSSRWSGHDWSSLPLHAAKQTTLDGAEIRSDSKVSWTQKKWAHIVQCMHSLRPHVTCGCARKHTQTDIWRRCLAGSGFSTCSLPHSSPSQSDAAPDLCALKQSDTWLSSVLLHTHTLRKIVCISLLITANRKPVTWKHMTNKNQPCEVDCVGLSQNFANFPLFYIHVCTSKQSCQSVSAPVKLVSHARPHISWLWLLHIPPCIYHDMEAKSAVKCLYPHVQEVHNASQ